MKVNREISGFKQDIFESFLDSLNKNIFQSS